MARKERTQILIGDANERIKAQCKNLHLFEPHDLRSLIIEARTSHADSELDQAVVLAFRRHNQRQIVALLGRLGVDPLQPDAWQKGFFRLACRHYGLGRLGWKPLRKKRNAATWTPGGDLNLLVEITKLTANGLSESRAIKKIVSNPRMRRLFPYHAQQNRAGSHFSLQNEVKRREAALWRRLQHLKASSTEKTILDQLLGPGWIAQSASERALYALELSRLKPKSVMKIQPSSR